MTDFLTDLLGKQKKVADGVMLDFRVHRSALEKALAQVESVIPSKDLIPVLKNFHLKVGADFDLRVTGSDAVMSVVTHATVLMAPTPGEAVFPAQRFLHVVREASGDLHIKVTAKKEKYSAVIKSGNTSWTIPLMSPAGYPDFTKVEEFGTVPVERQGFLAALQQVRKAASLDPMRPYLMMVDITGGKMRASDSIRFQQVKFDFPFDCQIPVRGAHEVVQRLSSSNLENIEVGQSDTGLLFDFGKTLLIVQKIAAKFPDVDEVLLKPTLSNDQELKVDREALLKAVRRVRITADDTTSAVVLSLNSGSCSVESKDRKGGTSVETVEAEWSHAPRHVSFNHQHLTDMLSSTKSESCTFRLGKDLKTRPTPLLMEDEKTGFVAALSQIRLDWL